MKPLQIIILVFVVSMTYGQTNLDQSVIPPSPNSMAIMKQANLPVDEYTGTARINIPIYSIPTNSINIPVSLDYRATGIRVQDIASNVGRVTIFLYSFSPNKSLPSALFELDLSRLFCKPIVISTAFGTF